MNYTECIENARPRLGKYCKACPECNGRACKKQTKNEILNSTTPFGGGIYSRTVKVYSFI